MQTLTAPEGHLYITAADLAAHQAGELTAAPYTAARIYLGAADTPARYTLITAAQATQIAQSYDTDTQDPQEHAEQPDDETKA